MDVCRVHGVCFATSSGVAKVRGGCFAGQGREGPSEDEGGRNMEMNSLLVIALTFAAEELDVEADLLPPFALDDETCVGEICSEGEGERARLIGRALLFETESKSFSHPCNPALRF